MYTNRAFGTARFNEGSLFQSVPNKRLHCCHGNTRSHDVPPSPPRVGVALESAHKEQGKRLAYTNYLVQSHMKFLDVQLQVRAMQSTVDR